MNPIPARVCALNQGVLFWVVFTSGTLFAQESLPKEIAARLEQKWIANAKQIRTPEFVIFYHGSAPGATAPDGKHWAGEIEGEVLVLTSTMATACPKVRLGGTGSIAVIGTSQSSVASGAPLWRKLLKTFK